MRDELSEEADGDGWESVGAVRRVGLTDCIVEDDVERTDDDGEGGVE